MLLLFMIGSGGHHRVGSRLLACCLKLVGVSYRDLNIVFTFTPLPKLDLCPGESISMNYVLVTVIEVVQQLLFPDIDLSDLLYCVIDKNSGVCWILLTAH